MTYNEALKALDDLCDKNAAETIRQLLTMQMEPCANCPLIPIRPVWKENKIYCGACGKRIPRKINAHYCHKCGRMINWL